MCAVSHVSVCYTRHIGKLNVRFYPLRAFAYHATARQCITHTVVLLPACAERTHFEVLFVNQPIIIRYWKASEYWRLSIFFIILNFAPFCTTAWCIARS